MPKTLTKPQPVDLDGAPILATIQEVALTIKRSPSSLRRDIKLGRLRAVQIGRSVRIDLDSVRALVRGAE